MTNYFWKNPSQNLRISFPRILWKVKTRKMKNLWLLAHLLQATRKRFVFFFFPIFDVFLLLLKYFSVFEVFIFIFFTIFDSLAFSVMHFSNFLEMWKEWTLLLSNILSHSRIYIRFLKHFVPLKSYRLTKERVSLFAKCVLAVLYNDLEERMLLNAEYQESQVWVYQ